MLKFSLTLAVLFSTLISAPYTLKAATDLEISNAWARAGKPNSAAFMKIKNISAVEKKIVAAHTESAQYTELHDHIQDGDVLKMRKVETLVIPAGGEIELMPGGKHIMFFGLGKGLEAGQDLHLELNVDDGSKINLTIPVKPMTHNPKLKACDCHKKKSS